MPSLRGHRLSVCIAHLTLLSLAFVGAVHSVSAQSIPGAVLAQREPHHHLVYADSSLRVLRVRVPAHDTTLLHEHDPDYFWIALGASEVVNAKLGAPDAVISSADLSIHYTVGKFAHVARNPGTVPFDNITVELLRTQTGVHNLCVAAIGTLPLECAPGAATSFSGTAEQTAWASDQLRVSLLTIAAGATLRPTTGTRRTTLIALDTMDTRAVLRITGDGQWIGGVYRPSSSAPWTVTNTGARAVRVLAVVPR